MKPAWDQLGTVFKESDTVLIGDVDCTASVNKELCSTHGVKGCEPAKLLPEARPFCASAFQTVTVDNHGSDLPLPSNCRFAVRSLRAVPTIKYYTASDPEGASYEGAPTIPHRSLSRSCARAPQMAPGQACRLRRWQRFRGAKNLRRRITPTELR